MNQMRIVHKETDELIQEVAFTSDAPLPREAECVIINGSKERKIFWVDDVIHEYHIIADNNIFMAHLVTLYVTDTSPKIHTAEAHSEDEAALFLVPSMIGEATRLRDLLASFTDLADDKGAVKVIVPLTDIRSLLRLVKMVLP